MAKMKTSKRFKTNFNLGGIAAESDPLLSTAYWDNGDFAAISSFDDPHCFIIGRTGSGKSAALQHLEEQFPSRVVRIVPENLSLPYITNLSVIPQLMDLGVHLDLFFKALWKHVIVVEIPRHRYKINSPEKKRNVLNTLKQKLQSDPVKIRALAYLDEFGDKFWCETDERVKQVVENFGEKVASSTGGKIGMNSVSMSLGGNVDESYALQVQREVVNKYQTIVNETQIPRLNEVISVLSNEILSSSSYGTYLIIDDLDKQWVDEKIANDLIRCLFQAVIDMQHVRYLKIIVALRTNIFDQLNFGSQSRGGQEEKFRGLSLYLRWTESGLRALLDTRAEAASRLNNIDPPRSLADLLPPSKNKTRVNPFVYILSRTLMRPRDAIQYVNDCLREATGKDRVNWENIQVAEKKYSMERLLALRDEWKDPYYDIERVLRMFHGKPSRMSRSEISTVLGDIAMMTADDDFLGNTWLSPMVEQWWEVDGDESKKPWFELYGKLVGLLYYISFLGVAKNAHSATAYSYQVGELAQFSSNLDESACFEIHPAFHKALDLQD